MGLYKIKTIIDNSFMEQAHLFTPIPNDKYDLLTREELILLHKGELDLNRQLQEYTKELLDQLLSSEQKSFLLEEQTINIKNKLFGKSSEKSSKISIQNKEKKKSPKKRLLLPSERYPNIDVIEKDVTLDEAPSVVSN